MPNKYGEKDWLDTALPLLNSLEIVDKDADGEILFYALIEGTEENKEVLRKAGVTSQEIMDSTGDSGKIDLTHFIWKFANWFNGEKFVRENPFDDM
ncbi:hypothetical protein LCM23_25285 [Cytobacillus kochii]|uniref:hypothetical protein n=1 Tax=Cytobacillus kochii TaxID=859143 RepID=UPI001CD3F791|nr:hypothetical protein [Cytobacillus kochii]MCA1029330.1 hypothetical protein [Cytobacillus kochii]